MVVAVSTPIEQEPPWREERKVHCSCGRFLTQARCHAALPASTVWIHIKCQGCGKWRWIDTVTGEVADEPRAPMIH